VAAQGKARRAAESELATVKDRTARSLAEFEALRTALMRDLQNRCEKVPPVAFVPAPRPAPTLVLCDTAGD
jgi:hypothetical protein